jgi:hypothetical protein
VTAWRTLRIPAAQADSIVAALLDVYARRIDRLAAAVRAYRHAREPHAGIEDARRAVIETEAMLDVTGWVPGPRHEGIEVAGPPGDVRDVIYAALVAAADGVGVACRAYERGRIDRPALASAVAGLAGLHELFAALEAADAPDDS